jgi:hypothetical protein
MAEASDRLVNALVDTRDPIWTARGGWPNSPELKSTLREATLLLGFYELLYVRDLVWSAGHTWNLCLLQSRHYPHPDPKFHIVAIASAVQPFVASLKSLGGAFVAWDGEGGLPRAGIHAPFDSIEARERVRDKHLEWNDQAYTKYGDLMARHCRDLADNVRESSPVHRDQSEADGEESQIEIDTDEGD